MCLGLIGSRAQGLAVLGFRIWQKRALVEEVGPVGLGGCFGELGFRDVGFLEFRVCVRQETGLIGMGFRVRV